MHASFLRRQMENGKPLTVPLLPYHSLVVENLEESKSNQEQEEATVVLPPVHSITAGQINDLSFATKHQKRRQKRLAANTPEADATRSALADLSQNSINKVATIEEVEAAQEVRRQSRKACRDFENADWRLRDMHTQELQTTRVYATLAAQQRHKVKDIVLAESRDAAALDHQIERSVKSNDVDPDLSKTVVFEDIPDVAAKPEDANPEIIRSARDQSKNANPEAIRCDTDQTKVIEDPTSKERLNTSTKGKGVAIETIEDTMATRSKSKYIVWLKDAVMITRLCTRFRNDHLIVHAYPDFICRPGYGKEKHHSSCVAWRCRNGCRFPNQGPCQTRREQAHPSTLPVWSCGSHQREPD